MKVLARGLPNVLDGTTFRPLQRNKDCHVWSSDIENDLFVGKSMLFMRHKNPDQNGEYHQSLWEGKSRVFSLQMQGKFKRKPVGGLCFLVSTLDDASGIGYFYKRLCKLWLAFAQSFEPGLDANLKNEPGRPLMMVAPLSPSWICMLETKQGEPLPKLGVRLPPYKECIEKVGRNLGNLSDPDTTCTYTIEWYTMNLDTMNWNITNIAVLPTISLSNLAPPVAGIPNSSGFFACVREMGEGDSKFLQHGPQCRVTSANIVHLID